MAFKFNALIVSFSFPRGDGGFAGFRRDIERKQGERLVSFCEGALEFIVI
ncbi:MAG: hypothetical protein HKN14_08220 [Marinicaulis sp.]|nr:hypothetical protein [Marinicaulis sp.]NNL87726.1 hypothetical protein [Marinicaulis sp.]